LHFLSDPRFVFLLLLPYSVPAMEITPSLAGGVINVPSDVAAIIPAADIILDGENTKQQCHVQDNCHSCESQFTPFQLGCFFRSLYFKENDGCG